MEAAIARGEQPGQTPVNLEEKPRGAFSQTPLLMATSASGNMEVIDVLLKHGADVNHIGPENFTALYYASMNGHVDVADTLLQNGANGIDTVRQHLRQKLEDAKHDAEKARSAVSENGAKPQ